MADSLIQILKAISDESRLKIIKLLLTNSYCVRALSKRIKISEAAVSQHLQVLRKANLVIGIKRGYFMHYEVDRDAIKKIGNSIISLVEKRD